MPSPSKSPSFNYFQVLQQYNSQNNSELPNNQLMNLHSPQNNQPLSTPQFNNVFNISTPQPSGIFTHSPSNPLIPDTPSDQPPSPDFNFPPVLSPYPHQTNTLANQSDSFYNFLFPTSTDYPDIFQSSTDNQCNSIINFLNLYPNQQISNLLTRILNIQKTINQYSQRTNLSSSYYNYIDTLTDLQTQFKSQLQSSLLSHIQNQILLRSPQPSYQLSPPPQKNNITPTSNSLSTDISDLQQRLSVINKKKSISKNQHNIVQSALQQQLQLLLQLQRTQKV